MAEPASALPVAPEGELPDRPRPGPVPVPMPVDIDITPPTSEMHGDVQERPREINEQLRSAVHRSYSELQGAVSRVFSRANARFRYIIEERPVQIVVGVAVASFLIGAALRIWRSNHD